MRRHAGLLIAAVVIAMLTTAGLADAAAEPGRAATSTQHTATQRTATQHKPTSPFYAVNREHLKVPKGVMPWDPSWAPDGKHILFQDYHRGYEWTADADGSRVRCLTCRMKDHPAIIGGFSYVFPGNKRMFLANELGDSVYVLTCAPSLFHCRRHHWLPVDLRGDATPTELNLGRRTYHLAPDGVHVGYTITRPDGLVMLVAKLKRVPGAYRLVDYRVVNPPGPASALDTDPDGWANGGSLDELKSFADGGRSVLVLTEPDGVPQESKINLATGKVTQLTSYPDWNEDGAFSPDGGSLLTESWRTEHRLTAISLMPLARSFISLGDPIFAIYYVSSRPAFACDLQPWLLPASGDDGGRLVGQPLNPYDGGTSIPANNLDGQQVWSPDSTRVLLQERSLRAIPKGANPYLQQKGPAPSELVIAHIKRPPTKPLRTVATKVGAWAPTPQAYRSSFDLPGAHLVLGKRTGSAVVTIGGDVIAGAFSVVFTHYSDDGKYFLDGTQTISGSVEAAQVITNDLTATDASGKTVGYLRTDLTFRQIEPAPGNGEPGVTMSGTSSASWLGKTATGLPKVGPCPQTMPRRSRLSMAVHLRRQHGTAVVVAHVASDIHGDERPVQGATVTAAGRRARTDRDGDAVLHLRLARQRRNVGITASAGNTFVPTHHPLHLPASGDI